MSQASQQDFWPDVSFHTTCLKMSRSKHWVSPCQWVPWINPAANISSNHSAFRPVNLSETNWSSHRWARMTICKTFSRVTMMSCSSVCVCVTGQATDWGLTDLTRASIPDCPGQIILLPSHLSFHVLLLHKSKHQKPKTFHRQGESRHGSKNWKLCHHNVQLVHYKIWKYKKNHE